MGLTNADTSLTVELVSILDEFMDTLANREPAGVWVLADGVDGIGFIRVYDGEGGCDGIVVTVDLTNGIRLASLFQDHRSLTGGNQEGYDSQRHAVMSAMTRIADVANQIVAAYRQAR